MRITRAIIKFILVLIIILNLWPAHSLGLSNDILISELSTGQNGATAEFVRLFNTSINEINTRGWRLQYKAAGGSIWSTKATLQYPISAGGSLLLATATFQTAQEYQLMLGGLAASGGHLQIIDSSNISHDLVGWGSAAQPLGKSAPAPNASQTLKRKTTPEGGLVNTGNNYDDFELAENNLVPVPADLAPVRITELLPNPAAPQSDANDEFIELFNSGVSSVDITGYKLQTGNTAMYNYVFKAGTVLPANSFVSFKSNITKLTLSNSGGQARLFDAQGNKIDESSAYGQAPDGQTWALINGSWEWTTTQTPSASNIFTSMPVKQTTSTQSVPKTAAAKTVKKTPTPKASIAGAATNKKVAKKSTAGATNQNSSGSASFPKTSKVHPLVLAGVGTSALAYAGYEYRKDLANRYHKLAGYFKNRRKPGAKLYRRRSL